MLQRAKLLQNLSRLAVGVCLFLIPFGALVRLKGAGLSCPDWPLCHDQVIPPAGIHGVWYEVLHRYIAGSLVLLVFALLIISWRQGRGPVFVTSLLAFLIILFQALLGALTIWIALDPWVVSLHLLFGHLTLAFLVWAFLLTAEPRAFRSFRNLWPIVLLLSFLGVLVLGGMNASTLSGYSCSSFPFCNSLAETPYWNLFLPTDWQNLLQMLHRILATLFLGVIFYLLFAKKLAAFKSLQLVMVFALVQFMLGISNSLSLIFLPISVAHSFFASVITVFIVKVIFLEYTEPKP